MSAWNVATDYAINSDLYDVDYDETTGLWCVFLGEKAVASFCSREEAQEHLDRLLG